MMMMMVVVVAKQGTPTKPMRLGITRLGIYAIRGSGELTRRLPRQGPSGSALTGCVCRAQTYESKQTESYLQSTEGAERPFTGAYINEWGSEFRNRHIKMGF